jgi:hypothetical protein
VSTSALLAAAILSEVVGGRVVDGNGNPIPGALVWANGRFERTDEEGAFFLTDVGPGPVRVEVLHESHATLVRRGVRSGTEDLELVLYRRSRLAARVLDAATLGPIARFKAELHPPDPLRPPVPFGYDLREPDSEKPGAIEMEALAPGRYCLEVRAEKYGTECVDVELGEGEEKTGIEVLLHPAATVRGTVLDRETGRPIGNARLGLVTGCGIVPTMTTTRLDGTFVIAGLAPGSVRLRVEAPHHVAIESDPIEIRPGEELAGIVLSVGTLGVIQGFAVDRAGRRYVRGGAYIRQPGVPGVRGVTFDSEGAFRFEGLDAGTYEVEAVVLDVHPAEPGRGPLLARVVVEYGKTSEVILRPAP